MPIIYYSRTLIIKEAINVKFDDIKPNTKISELNDFITDLRVDDGIGSSTIGDSLTKVQTRASPRQQG